MIVRGTGKRRNIDCFSEFVSFIIDRNTYTLHVVCTQIFFLREGSKCSNSRAWLMMCEMYRKVINCKYALIFLLRTPMVEEGKLKRSDCEIYDRIRIEVIAEIFIRMKKFVCMKNN